MVILDSKRLVPPLPYMPGTVIMPVITPNMSGHQPLYPGTQVAVFMRPQYHMKMVRHQAPRQHTHWQPFSRLAYHLRKTQIVLIFMKNLGPIVAAIDYMIIHTPCTGSWFPWHNDSIIGTPLHINKQKSSLTPFLSPITSAFGSSRVLTEKFNREYYTSHG